MRDKTTFTSACRRTGIIALAFGLLASTTASAQNRRGFGTPRNEIPGDDIFKLGATFDIGWFSEFGKRVADQPNLATSTADDVAPGFGVSMELSPTGMRPLFTRVSMNYGIQDFAQVYTPASPVDPTTSKGRVKSLFLDGQVGLRLFKTRRTVFKIATGGTWTRSNANIDFDYAGPVVNVNRVANGWKWNAGANLWRSLDDRLGFQLGVTYTNSFKPMDADQNWRGSAGLTLGIGGGG